MTNTISSASGTSSGRPRLCRSEHQPNMLEYIDTTLSEAFLSHLKLQSTSLSNVYDQFGNALVDQYLLYILCQKLHPNRTDNRTEQIYHSLHQLLIFNGQISKALFEYAPASMNRANALNFFHNYTNFVWNELDVNILLELACFLLKYRLRDIFLIGTNQSRQKILGYFLETITIYYLSACHRDFFLNSRSKEMLFPRPSSIASSSDDEKDQHLFDRFLEKLSDNGEVTFDQRQIRMLLQSDAFQFLNKKLENKKIAFLNFFETILRFQREHALRSLKSLCRLKIKLAVQQFPNDIKQLSLSPKLTDRLLTYLTYENKFAFESLV